MKPEKIDNFFELEYLWNTTLVKNDSVIANLKVRLHRTRSDPMWRHRQLKKVATRVSIFLDIQLSGKREKIKQFLGIS